MKQCCRCKEVKPLSEFYKKSSTKDGYYYHCKLCQNIHGKKHYEKNKSYYISKAEKWRKDNPGGRHKISNAKVAELLAKFDGMCWICRENPATHIDHDHSCCDKPNSCGNCVRGILCASCNTGIGFLQDDVQILQAAIEYLKPVTPDVDR